MPLRLSAMEKGLTKDSKTTGPDDNAESKDRSEKEEDQAAKLAAKNPGADGSGSDDDQENLAPSKGGNYDNNSSSQKKSDPNQKPNDYPMNPSLRSTDPSLTLPRVEPRTVPGDNKEPVPSQPQEKGMLSGVRVEQRATSKMADIKGIPTAKAEKWKAALEAGNANDENDCIKKILQNTILTRKALGFNDLPTDVQNIQETAIRAKLENAFKQAGGKEELIARLLQEREKMAADAAAAAADAGAGADAGGRLNHHVAASSSSSSSSSFSSGPPEAQYATVAAAARVVIDDIIDDIHNHDVMSIKEMEQKIAIFDTRAAELTDIEGAYGYTYRATAPRGQIYINVASRTDLNPEELANAIKETLPIVPLRRCSALLQSAASSLRKAKEALASTNEADKADAIYYQRLAFEYQKTARLAKKEGALAAENLPNDINILKNMEYYILSQGSENCARNVGARHAELNRLSNQSVPKKETILQEIRFIFSYKPYNYQLITEAKFKVLDCLHKATIARMEAIEDGSLQHDPRLQGESAYGPDYAANLDSAPPWVQTYHAYLHAAHLYDRVAVPHSARYSISIKGQRATQPYYRSPSEARRLDYNGLDEARRLELLTQADNALERAEEMNPNHLNFGLK